VLLEQGKRPFTPRLAAKAVKMLRLDASALPLSGTLPDPSQLPHQLGSLGYPGYSYLHASKRANPYEVLLAALEQAHLETRVAEALPWLLFRYAATNQDNEKWLLDKVRLRNLTNRLGFVVTLARELAERTRNELPERYNALLGMETVLRESRLDREDTLAQNSLSEVERKWLRHNRSEHARYWHLLTDWRVEQLQYAE
jgi:hypothetical protein